MTDRLRRGLAARLMVVAAVVLAVVAVSAPIAQYVVGLRLLRVRTQAIASRIADVIAREAQNRPGLWLYDSQRLVDNFRAYRQDQDVREIVVVDPAGRRLDLGFELPNAATLGSPVVWESSPAVANGELVARAWVALPTEPTRRAALLLLVPFGVLAVALAGAVYVLPMRASGRAERQINDLIDRLQQSQAALAELNHHLEAQVEQRSSELQAAYLDLQSKERRLRELSQRAVELQEADRRSVARDLHDSAGQAMTAIRINLQLLEQRSEGEQRAMLTRTMGIVDGTLEEIRRVVSRLGPAELDDLGLAGAVRHMCEDLHDRVGAHVEFHALGDLGRLSGAQEVAVYRLVQEALTNVARHAEAQTVDVELVVDASEARIHVRDDGRGFDAEAMRQGAHGMVGMRERAELLGGEFEAAGSPGGGVRISARLPL